MLVVKLQLYTNLTAEAHSVPENCWKIECWIEALLPAQNPMKEYECLQSKFTKPFDVCWNNFMPTSHFPFYACFWILILTTGTFQLICIMSTVIIQRPLLRNKHVICPQNEFYDLLCNCVPLVTSERVVARQLLSPFSRWGYIFLVLFLVCVGIKCLVSCFFFFCSVLVCTFTLQPPWFGMFVTHVMCQCVFIYGCTIACSNLAFGGSFLRGTAKLERPPKILCSNWNCFISSLIN